MVWASGIFSKTEYGSNLGTSDKLYGQDWDNPTAAAPTHSHETVKLMRRASLGETLRREEFPEASYVFNETDFRKNAKDLFWAAGFRVVTGKLARILQNFDLGEDGGLIPYPIFKADKVTPYEGQFFLLKGPGVYSNLFSFVNVTIQSLKRYGKLWMSSLLYD